MPVSVSVAKNKSKFRWRSDIGRALLAYGLAVSVICVGPLAIAVASRLWNLQRFESITNLAVPAIMICAIITLCLGVRLLFLLSSKNTAITLLVAVSLVIPILLIVSLAIT